MSQVSSRHQFGSKVRDSSERAQPFEFGSMMFDYRFVRVEPFEVAFPLGIALCLKKRSATRAFLPVKFLQSVLQPTGLGHVEIIELPVGVDAGAGVNGLCPRSNQSHSFFTGAVE